MAQSNDGVVILKIEDSDLITCCSIDAEEDNVKIEIELQNSFDFACNNCNFNS